MRWIKRAWIALLVLFFVIFSHWYGGQGTPISSAEGAELIAKLEASFGTAPTSERTFVDNMIAMIPEDDGKEFYAVNLERLKAGPEAQTADQAYARTVIPLLFERAGHPVFVSHRAGLMLGNYGADVDRVAVVRYRSLRDLIDMAIDPAMIAGSPNKFLALEHTEVFITRPTITFVQVRLLLALLLIVLGAIGLKLMNWIAQFRHARANSS